MEYSTARGDRDDGTVDVKPICPTSESIPGSTSWVKAKTKSTWPVERSSLVKARTSVASPPRTASVSSVSTVRGRTGGNGRSRSARNDPHGCGNDDDGDANTSGDSSSIVASSSAASGRKKVKLIESTVWATRSMSTKRAVGTGAAGVVAVATRSRPFASLARHGTTCLRGHRDGGMLPKAPDEPYGADPAGRLGGVATVAREATMVASSRTAPQLSIATPNSAGSVHRKSARGHSADESDERSAVTLTETLCELAAVRLTPGVRSSTSEMTA
mmetsp:Transcript_20240/g.62884  ORF Transcript_20240/g.62884 Transcript_20240/m.62884 type:complete len:273 (+) Transcript_20240:62-880(+)